MFAGRWTGILWTRMSTFNHKVSLQPKGFFWVSLSTFQPEGPSRVLLFAPALQSSSLVVADLPVAARLRATARAARLRARAEALHPKEPSQPATLGTTGWSFGDLQTWQYTQTHPAGSLWLKLFCTGNLVVCSRRAKRIP